MAPSGPASGSRTALASRRSPLPSLPLSHPLLPPPAEPSVELASSPRTAPWVVATQPLAQTASTDSDFQDLQDTSERTAALAAANRSARIQASGLPALITLSLAPVLDVSDRPGGLANGSTASLLAKGLVGLWQRPDLDGSAAAPAAPGGEMDRLQVEGVAPVALGPGNTSHAATSFMSQTDHSPRSSQGAAPFAVAVASAAEPTRNDGRS